MNQFEPWIAKHIREEKLNDLSQKELSLVLHELQINRISISGGGLFSMTYSHAAQVLKLCHITLKLYATIILLNVVYQVLMFAF